MADEKLIDILKKRIAYVMNRVGSTTFKHVETRAKKNATKLWKNSNKMLVYFERVFGNPNRRQNAETEFQALRQDSKNFNTFWVEFQRLSIELDRNKAMLISNLTLKLTYKMQCQLSTGNKKPTDLFKYIEHCQRVSQRLKDAARTKAALERYIEKTCSSFNLLSSQKNCHHKHDNHTNHEFSCKS